MTFEYGSVAMPAVRALYRLPNSGSIDDKALDRACSHSGATRTSSLWQHVVLRGWHRRGKVSLSGVAALPLETCSSTPPARESTLYFSRIGPRLTPTPLSIADALLSFDPQEVIERILRPSIDKPQ